MANYVNFHSQLASIMEVLANAAVAEICQLVDDGFATLRLEISRTQRENLAIKSKLRLLEVRSGERCAKRAPVPSLVVTCARKDHHVGEEGSTSAKRNGKSTLLGNTGSQLSGPVGVADPPVEPEVVVIKEERLEDELTGCSVLEDHQIAPSSSIGLQSRSLPAESDRPLNVNASLNMKAAEIPRISLSGRYEMEDFAESETQQQQEEEEEEEEGEEEGQAGNLKIQQTDSGYNTHGRHSHPPDQNHGSLMRSSGPNRAKEITDLLPSQTEESKDACDVVRSVAESNSSKVLDAETPLIKTLDTDMALTNIDVNGLCGPVPSLAADWKREAVEISSTPVKMEAEMQPSWSEGTAFGTNLPLVPIPRKDKEEIQMNNSKLITNCAANSNSLSSQSHYGESESAESKSSELDTGGFDSSSFDDLFSSPEVARSLIAPHKDSADAVGGIEERLSSSSFPFLTGGTGFGNSPPSVSDPLADASFRNPSSDSRSRGFPSGPERIFSCQQCGRLFSNSRDLVVHQRSHAGERLFHCPLCKKPFLHLHQLKTHQRVHTGEKPFSCAQCGKRFSQSSHIKRHMSVHTGEKRYSCGLCGKRFSQACSLKVHQAVHTGERPYSCTQCGKCFSVLGNLVRHQSVHIGK